MGLLRWLKSWFRPKPARDVSTLAGDDADVTREAVASSNEPLRPMHRRKQLRDSRLLPKPKPKITAYSWNRSRKPRYFSKDEANRLFAATLRTRDRNLRDLAADEEQLSRYGLPLWRSEQDLADALGLSVKQLRHFSIHRHRETTPHYVTFTIPKRSGGQRTIHAPKRRLKAVLRKLHELLVSKLPVSPHAHGFRTEHSVASNAAPHVGKAIIVKLDIKDCFPSIHVGRVRGLLIALGYSYPVATTLAVLMTECPRQPVEAEGKVYHVPIGSRVCVQGAPTSPGLCNAVLRRLDYRLAGFARKHGFGYTRYADDLTFSGDDAAKVKLLITIAARIVADEGMLVNRDKTRVLRRSRRQEVTGVVVNHQLGLSRQERRRLRAQIHQLTRVAQLDPRVLRRLRGRLAYLNMLSPAQVAPLQRAFEQVQGPSSTR